MSTCLLQLRQKRFIGLRTKVAIKYSGKILKLKNDKAVKEMAVCQWCFIFQIRKFTNSCPPSQDMNLALVSTSARSPVYMFDICKSLLRETNKLKGYLYMWVYLLPECYWEFCILQLIIQCAYCFSVKVLTTLGKWDMFSNDASQSQQEAQIESSVQQWQTLSTLGRLLVGLRAKYIIPNANISVHPIYLLLYPNMPSQIMLIIMVISILIYIILITIWTAC